MKFIFNTNMTSRAGAFDIANVLAGFNHNLANHTLETNVGITTTNVPYYDTQIDLSPGTRQDVRTRNNNILALLPRAAVYEPETHFHKATTGSITDREFLIDNFYYRRKTTNEKAADFAGYGRISPFKFKSSTTRATLRELVLNKDVIVSSIEVLTMMMMPRGADRGIGSIASAAVSLPYIRGFVDNILSALTNDAREAVSEMIATCWQGASRLNTPSTKTNKTKQPIRSLSADVEDNFIIEDIVAIMNRMDIDTLNNALESINVRLLDDKSFAGMRVLVASIRAALATYIECIDAFLDARPRNDDALGQMLAAVLISRSANFTDLDFIQINNNRSDCKVALQNLQWFMYAKAYADQAQYDVRPEIAELLTNQLRRYLRGGQGAANRYKIATASDITELIMVRSFKDDELSFSRVHLKRNASYVDDTWRITNDRFIGVSGVGYYGQWNFGNTNVTIGGGTTININNNDINYRKIEKKNATNQESLYDKLTMPALEYFRHMSNSDENIFDEFILERRLCLIDEPHDSNDRVYLNNLIRLFTLLSSPIIMQRISDTRCSLLLKVNNTRFYGRKEYSTHRGMLSTTANIQLSLLDEQMVYTDDLVSAIFVGSTNPNPADDYDESRFFMESLGVRDNFINFVDQNITHHLIDCNTAPVATWLRASAFYPEEFVTTVSIAGRNEFCFDTTTMSHFMPNTFARLTTDAMRVAFFRAMRTVTLTERQLVTDAHNLAGLFKYNNDNYLHNSMADLRIYFDNFISQLHLYDEYSQIPANSAIEIKQKRHYEIPTRQLTPSMVSTLALNKYMELSTVFSDLIPLFVDNIKEAVMTFSAANGDVVDEAELVNYLLGSSLSKFILRQMSLIFFNKVWVQDLTQTTLSVIANTLPNDSLLYMLVPHANNMHSPTTPATNIAITHIYQLFNTKVNEQIYGGF